MSVLTFESWFAGQLDAQPGERSLKHQQRSNQRSSAVKTEINDQINLEYDIMVKPETKS